jgi:murein DD-endopeptidase MepM/ murein hydrolase activator NlpD
MFIRNARDDAKFRGQPGVHEVLNSPAGGAFGMVRFGNVPAHQGWDIYAPVNTPIVAISDGIIVGAERHTGYGMSITLKFQFSGYPDGLFAFYAHLAQVSVAKNQSVREGQTLGATGTDGNAHGKPPHLHFEIRTIDPCYQNPKDRLHGRISPGKILGGHYGL